MNFFKKNWKLVLIIMIISIAYPIIILTSSKYGIIEYDTGLEIVTYGGSIIGGFLTLYGVWWTIKNQNKEILRQQREFEVRRKRDLAIQYEPMFIISFTSPFSNPPKGIDPIINYKKNKVQYFLWIKNVGRGNAKNVDINIVNIGNNYHLKFEDDYMKHFDVIVPSQNGISLIIDLYNHTNISRVSPNHKEFELNVTYKCPFDEKFFSVNFIIKHDFLFIKNYNHIIVETYHDNKY